MAGPKKTALFLGFPRAFFARAPGRQAELFFSIKKLSKHRLSCPKSLLLQMSKALGMDCLD